LRVCNFKSSKWCSIDISKLGKEWAFVVLISDGISSILSDEEIVDLARDASNPKIAAERILAFSEELGGDDNATAIVIPLAGWGKVQGPDKTKDLREYRRRQAGANQTFIFHIAFYFNINATFTVGSERQRRM
jgi:serine/threonine protein phosphatase PrpC